MGLVKFRPGWDCHGMPIEHKVLKSIMADASLGDAERSSKMQDPLFVRQESRNLATSCIESQKLGFKRWGISADWEDPYLTFDTNFVIEELKVLMSFYEKGLLFRGSRPVHFSPSSQSVLADSEIEYREMQCTAVYVAFPLSRLPDSWKSFLPVEDAGVSVLIWTTQPWTLWANAAVAFNPVFHYVLTEEQNSGRFLLLERSAVDRLQSIEGFKLKIVAEIDPRQLKDVSYNLPISTDGSKNLYEADFVTSDCGSGFVHVAPSHGLEDFNLAQKNSIRFHTPVDQSGIFTSSASPELTGKLAIGDGNVDCINLLERSGLLLSKEKISHSYPCDWRTKEPVMTLLSQQWFIDVSKIVPGAIKALDDVSFVPGNSKDSFVKLLNQRTSWCISRQRHWGVPLPVFYDREDNVYFDRELLDNVIRVLKEKGLDSWWMLEAEQFLPTEYHNKALRKGSDILDVWFDSGTSWQTIFGLNNECRRYDKVFYVEGRDQFRGWFQSSLLTCFAIHGTAPFSHLYSHGFVLDHRQNKMSKSEGNVVDPSWVASKYGADTLRLWVALADSTDDIAFSERILEKTHASYNKFRALLRVMCGNLYDFDTCHRSVLNPIDRLIMWKCDQIISQCFDDMQSLSFHSASHRLLNFVHDDVSNFYLNSIKDRLYCEHSQSEARRSAQTAIAYILTHLLGALEPFLPHLCTEVRKNATFQNIPLFLAGAGKRLAKENGEGLSSFFCFLQVIKSLLMERVGNDPRNLEKCDLSVDISKDEQIQSIIDSFKVTQNCMREVLGCRSVSVYLINSHQENENYLELNAQCSNFSGVKIAYAFNENCVKCPRCRLQLSDATDCLCSRCERVIDKLSIN